MGKKRKKANYSRTSICKFGTPTYNRRIFISQMVKNVEKQDYPKDKFEWIIIDDGDDCIEDLIPKDSRQI